MTDGTTRQVLFPPDPGRMFGVHATGNIGRTWTEHPDPYTEIECMVVRKRSFWKDVIRNIAFITVFIVAANEAITALGLAFPISIPPIGVGPWWAWYVVMMLAWGFWLADGGITPYEINRSRRSRLPDTSLWSSWSSGLHCQIDNAPLVPVSDGLRCRECGRKHTFTGDLTGGKYD